MTTPRRARAMLDTLQGLDANGRAVLGLPPLTDTAERPGPAGTA